MNRKEATMIYHADRGSLVITSYLSLCSNDSSFECAAISSATAIFTTHVMGTSQYANHVGQLFLSFPFSFSSIVRLSLNPSWTNLDPNWKVIRKIEIIFKEKSLVSGRSNFLNIKKNSCVPNIFLVEKN